MISRLCLYYEKEKWTLILYLNYENHKKVLLISSTTVIVCSWGAIRLNSFDTVLFNFNFNILDHLARYEYHPKPDNVGDGHNL